MQIALLTVFIVSYFLHLPARVPYLGTIRFEMALGLVILIMVILCDGSKKDRWSEEPVRKLKKFMLYIFLSLPLVTWPGSVLRFHLEEWVKVSLFFVLVVGVVRSTRQLKWLITVFLGCQLFRVFEPLYLHQTHGYWGDVAYSHVGGKMTGLSRLSGAPFDVVNPNQLAWVAVTTIPFLYFFLWRWNNIGKILFLILSTVLFYCLILTGSRSGLLSVVFTAIAIILLSEKKIKNFAVAAIVFLPVAVWVLSRSSADMQIRFSSLINSEAAGADTAQGRLNSLVTQIGSISNNPLFGNGLGTSGETNRNVIGGKAQITHNLFIEIIQETGLIGFAFFMLFIASVLKSLRHAKATLEEAGLVTKENWLYRLISATVAWIVMDLFYSLSCFGLRSWEWYFFGAVSTLCLVFAKECSSAESIKT